MLGGVGKVRELGIRERTLLEVSTCRGTSYVYEVAAYERAITEYSAMVGRQSDIAVAWFFTNVHRSMIRRAKGFTVNLDKNHWTGNPCKVGYRGVVRVLEWMEYNGYITVLKGNKNLYDSRESHISVVRFTEKLLAKFDPSVLQLSEDIEEQENVIVVKDRVSKKEIEYEKTEETEKMAEEMNRYNTSLQDVDIRMYGEPVSRVEYKRSFTGDLYSGGRLYVHGGHIQTVKAIHRLEGLTIMGDKVIELDYKAIHPNLLFEATCGESPEFLEEIGRDHDPYDVYLSSSMVDNQIVAEHKIKWGIEKYDPLRKLVKMGMMRAINCSSHVEAVAGLSNELAKDSFKEEQKRQFIGLNKPDSGAVLNAIKEHNHWISDHFFEDKGVKLQFLDSEIALRVIDIMQQHSEPILCWHDSFVVREQAEDKLYAAMNQAWLDIMKSNHFCKIEKR